MLYQCLDKNVFQIKEYQIVPIRCEDIESIRVWRNAQIDVLRQNAPLTCEDQQTYFQKQVWPTFQQAQPSQILFSFLLHGRCIGYGGLTNLEWQHARGEISFLVDPHRAGDDTLYRQDFNAFLSMLCQVAFECLHLHRLFSETYAFRHSTLAVLEHIGFKQEGILREHVYKKDRWIDSIMLGLVAQDWVKRSSLVQSQSVLITSISKKMPLIAAVRLAANKLGQFQQVYGCDSQASCIGQYGVDLFWHCQSLEKLTLKEILLYCQDNTIGAIIPTRDADLEFYARHLDAFHAKGIYPMVSSWKTVVSCKDKFLFAEILSTHHLPVIPTYLSLKELDSTFFVVKERIGAGSLQLGLRLSRHEALAHSKKLKDPIFQPFIEGKEWSVDLYRTKEKQVKGCIARQRNIIVDGESQVTTTQSNLELELLCIKIADLLDIYGHAVFQLIEDGKGDFHVIECNPRFGGASTLSLAAGLDSFFWFFIECLGLSLHDYPFVRCKGEIRQVRYLTDRMLPWSSFSI